jgi:hypothetical protein
MVGIIAAREEFEADHRMTGKASSIVELLVGSGLNFPMGQERKIASSRPCLG